MPVDLEKFEADLKAIKTWEGMSDDELKGAITGFKGILNNALRAEDLTPKEKGQLVTKYLKIWRRDKSFRVKPYAPLTKANLREADLREADLQASDLRRADLQRADLRGAMLFEAMLFEADLQGADLQGANLEHADLEDAKLQDANLQAANLLDAYLRGADLKDANLQGAILIDADLTNARNLTQAQRDSTITTSEQLAETIQSIHDLPDTDITEEHLIWLPTLRMVAVDCQTNKPDRKLTKALCKKFPWFSQETPEHWESEAKSRLMKGNFGKVTKFLQNTVLPPELKVKIVSEVIAGTSAKATAEPDRLSSRIASILTDQAQQPVGKRSFSAREATDLKNLVTPREQSILARIQAEREAAAQQQRQGRQH